MNEAYMYIKSGRDEEGAEESEKIQIPWNWGLDLDKTEIELGEKLRKMINPSTRDSDGLSDNIEGGVNNDSVPSASSPSSWLDFGDVLGFDMTNSREVTVIFSTLCVCLLLLMSFCLWCCIKYCRRRINNNNLYMGRVGQAGDSDRKNLCCPKKGEKFRIIPHKNIFTPDQNVSFVVPTVNVPLQSQTRNEIPTRVRRLSASGPLLEAANLLGSENRVPMVEQPFYPQLYSLEDQSSGTPRLAYSLFYSTSSQMLHVKIICGQHFPGKIEHSVKIKLYPGRSAKQRTKAVEGPTPEFYEEFNFHLRKYVLPTKVLKLRVVGTAVPSSSSGLGAGPSQKGGFGNGNGNGNGHEKMDEKGKSLLGCINIPLAELKGLELDGQEDYRTGTIWKPLENPSLSDGVKLCASLKWAQEPSPGLLTLKILQASGLHEMTDADYTSSYVKVTLQEQGKNMKSRKTRLIRWGSVPNYDDTFVVTLPHQLLSQISFLLVVIARGRLGTKQVLGRISIGPVPFASGSGSGSGTAFWADMCHKPDTEIVRSLHLMP